MIAPAQRKLNLPVSQRTVLVDVNSVRAARGVDADTVFEDVEEGRLLWVWDISAGFQVSGVRGIRELRFWAREIVAPEQMSELTLEIVIDSILPKNRDWFRGTEVAQLLMVSRPTVDKALREELGAVVVGHTIKIERIALVNFFRRRWTGVAQQTTREAK